jgi:hypothetical protein
MLSYFRIAPPIDRTVNGVALLLLLVIADQAYRGYPVSGYGAAIAFVSLLLCIGWVASMAAAVVRLALSVIRTLT